MASDPESSIRLLEFLFSDLADSPGEFISLSYVARVKRSINETPEKRKSGSAKVAKRERKFPRVSILPLARQNCVSGRLRPCVLVSFCANKVARQPGPCERTERTAGGMNASTKHSPV
jgi:hypothetical protein